MARRTKEEADATRESVLMAALDLFAEKGYSRTTLAGIAKRIGMTRGAVYWHFDNKEALLAALIDHVHELKEDVVHSQISNIQTIDDLRKACILHAQMVESDPVVHKFEFFMMYQMEWSEELLEQTKRNMDELRENPLDSFKKHFNQPQIAARLNPGVDTNLLVMTLASFWVGACKICLGYHFPDSEVVREDGETTGTGVSFVKTVERGFDLIMNGVLKKEA
ncbi:TetR/AcrR family transcriptional regulator [Tichowtungia aerotolerans]|uniref:TetR family transcriptional regulator n=1 Tax=Tichowtungia aerotolerans TaxID=2697043 RepID=A0A6P1M5M3_9BACT|nr:TetR family transcriptional regulator [Tichowtungia aerotolerans]QHI69342.1 TetR family transcriptional regulator [Tichowtungia aerotolerans]